MAKQITKVTIQWSLNNNCYSGSGDLKLNFNKYPIDDEIYNCLIKRFESGNITGYKISPSKTQLKAIYKRQFFENGILIEPIFPEYEYM